MDEILFCLHLASIRNQAVGIVYGSSPHSSVECFMSDCFMSTNPTLRKKFSIASTHWPFHVAYSLNHTADEKHILSTLCVQPTTKPVHLPPPAKYHLKTAFPQPKTTQLEPFKTTYFSSLSPETLPMASDTQPMRYYWGDMPEEEFYTSQGVRNTQSYFDTPNGKIFTQSFLPLDQDQPIKGSVYMTHGYASDTGWMFQKICINYATWGYAVFTADLLGHGRSDGIRGYLGDMEKVAASSLSYFYSVRTSEPYRDLPAFLFGESMGCAVTMLMYFQSQPNTWTGLIFSAPLFVLPDNMKPSKVRLFLYGLLFGMADTWSVMPDNRMVGKAIKDPELLRIISANPRRYDGAARVGTMREISRVSEYVQNNFSKVTAPFLTVHGTADGVTSQLSSELLYEKSPSEDKTLKLYEGMHHSLIQGEPEENSQRVLADMREWIDERVKRYGSKN